jgi:uncharacterized membrane protein
MDKRYKLTNKISLKFRIKQEWTAFFCLCCGMIIILIIAVLDIYVIDIPVTIFFILGGVLTGIVNGMSNKISIKKRE